MLHWVIVRSVLKNITFPTTPPARSAPPQTQIVSDVPKMHQPTVPNALKVTLSLSKVHAQSVRTTVTHAEAPSSVTFVQPVTSWCNKAFNTQETVRHATPIV